MTKRAICVTCGEQSENHVGMEMNGDGLAENGYSIKNLRKIKEKFLSLGGKIEWVKLGDGLDEEDREDADAAVVVIFRNGVDVLLKNAGSDKDSKDVFKELTSFEWDKKFWDTRRKTILNKHARFNVCFGEEGRDADFEEKKGTIIGYDTCPLLKIWKNELEKLCDEEENSLEGEGNLYYDVQKTGIGFHGDGERKKVVAGNFCDEGVVREINWVWFEGSKPLGKRTKIFLNGGDMYVMSEKATGFDWKKRSKKTLRHAAGVTGSKYLKIKDFEE
jgi:hypothetical protein